MEENVSQSLGKGMVSAVQMIYLDVKGIDDVVSGHKIMMSWTQLSIKKNGGKMLSLICFCHKIDHSNMFSS